MVSGRACPTRRLCSTLSHSPPIISIEAWWRHSSQLTPLKPLTALSMAVSWTSSVGMVFSLNGSLRGCVDVLSLCGVDLTRWTWHTGWSRGLFLDQCCSCSSPITYRNIYHMGRSLCMRTTPSSLMLTIHPTLRPQNFVSKTRYRRRRKRHKGICLGETTNTRKYFYTLSKCTAQIALY